METSFAERASKLVNITKKASHVIVGDAVGFVVGLVVGAVGIEDGFVVGLVVGANLTFTNNRLSPISLLSLPRLSVSPYPSWP